jgi:hypothetical protein
MLCTVGGGLRVAHDQSVTMVVSVCQVAAAQHWGDLPERSWGRRAWVAMRGAETVFKAASLLNFLVFLRFGRYRRAECQGVVKALAACVGCTRDCRALCRSTAAPVAERACQGQDVVGLNNAAP